MEKSETVKEICHAQYCLPVINRNISLNKKVYFDLANTHPKTIHL